jgi:acyl dehydratase
MSRTWSQGHEFEPASYVVRRSDLVKYAGASGDFNPIHWSDRVATSVGLPGVIAHGMYTLALAGNAVVGWVGDPASVLSLGARFTKPVVVPDDDEGTTVSVTGTVTSVEDDVATIDLTVTHADQKVLGMSRARVRC